VTLGDNGTTDRRTDRQTDRVRRNMRPPPREEGRIINVEHSKIIDAFILRWLVTAIFLSPAIAQRKSWS